jgi:hypothetical protein
MPNQDWATMTRILVRILTTKPLIFYYINMKLSNLDLKQEISSLEREGEGETERHREREIDRDRERESKT